MKNKIILASASPRRCEILQNTGFEFEIIKSDADESTVDGSGIPVELYVQELALLKATNVLDKVQDKDNTLIIGADTVVYSKGQILGKPADRNDAFRMLKSLSGDVHQVYTGFAIVRASDGMSICEYEKTDVEFKKLTDDEIIKYIETGEPDDKAGAYAIQGKGALFVKRIDGDFFNVVGLPVCKLASVMKSNFEMN